MGRIDFQAKVEKMQKNLKSGGKMAQMLMLDDNSILKKDLVFLPDSVFRRSWDVLMLLVILTNTITVPLRMGFIGQSDLGEGGELAWFGVNVLMDIILWVDIYLHYRRFGVVFDGLLISDRHEFGELFLNSSVMKLNIIASFPIDALAWLAGMDSYRSIGLARLGRLLYLVSMPNLMHNFVDFLEEKGIRAKASVWHLIKMTIFVLLTVHFLACTLFWVAFLEERSNIPSWAIVIGDAGYFSRDEILMGENVSLIERYCLCMYWSMYTITLVGYGDIALRTNSEMMLAILGMVTGAVLCNAGITAILSSLVHAMAVSAGEAQAFGQVITKYMVHRSLPLDLQEKIFGFFVHMHLTGDDLDEMKVLKSLPRFVRGKLLEEVSEFN